MIVRLTALLPIRHAPISRPDVVAKDQPITHRLRYNDETKRVPPRCRLKVRFNVPHEEGSHRRHCRSI